MLHDPTFSRPAWGPERRVLVVRPYGEHIRERVFRLLEDAGWTGNHDSIPTGTDDTRAVQKVLRDPARVLLVPFHGHRSEDGASVDGLRFLLRLHHEAGRGFRWRVLMPYSRFAAPALHLLWSSGTFERSYPQPLRDALMFAPPY